MRTLRSKRPEDRLDYDVDFGRWLTPGDAIASTTTEISGGAAHIDGHDFTATAVKVWVAGGADGETAHVTVFVTTAQGREKEACFRLRIREKC